MIMAAMPRHRPMRDMLAVLPKLAISSAGEVDYSASNPADLSALAEHAQDTMQVAQLGLSAIGLLLVRAAPEMDTGEISGDAIESLGWLMAELGELAGCCFALAASCREHLADATPRPP